MQHVDQKNTSAHCHHCQADFESKFCPGCGAPAQVHRMDRHYLWHELQHNIFHVEKGFLYTAKELLLHPGHMVQRYIAGDRSRHYKLVSFLIIASVLYTLIDHRLKPHGSEHLLQGNQAMIFQWIAGHYSYSNLIEALFIVLSLQLFFRKSGYNFVETLVLMCYLIGFGMLMGIPFLLLVAITHLTSINSVFALSVAIYTIWAIGQFYNHRRLISYIKALLAYLLGVFAFMFSALILGFVLTAMHIAL